MMRNTVRPLSPGLLCLLILLTFSQAGVSSLFAEGTAPHVNELALTAKGSQFYLNWIDSSEVRGPVYVFRSSSPFSESTIDRAVNLGEVPYGAGAYIDTPPEGAAWYYFVMPTDPNGSSWGLYTDIRNLASPNQAATAAGEPQFEKTATAEPTTAPSDKLFTGIDAEVKGDAVIISFTTTNPGESALLYRSAAPIKKLRDLLDAVIVQAASAVSPFTDYPIPGIPYFYALVSEKELKSGSVSVILGENSTRAPAEVQAGLYRVGLPGPSRDTRSMPLPLISTASLGPLSGPVTLAIPTELSPAARRAVSALIPRVEERKAAVRKSQAFPQDLEAPAGGEDYTLRSIVQSSFAKKDWSEASRQFSSYLSLPRSTVAEARARYYLGQCYYFTGELRGALFEFLLVKDVYPVEAGDWVRAIVAELPALK